MSKRKGKGYGKYGKRHALRHALAHCHTYRYRDVRLGLVVSFIMTAALAGLLFSLPATAFYDNSCCTETGFYKIGTIK